LPWPRAPRSRAPATAEERPPLAPNVPWTLEADDDSCALRRIFGEGDQRGYLEFRRFGPGPYLQTVIASTSMKARRTGDPFRYRFGNGEWQETGDRLTTTMAEGFSGVIFLHALVTIRSSTISSRARPTSGRTA
jgi:hypothetical protein